MITEQDIIENGVKLGKKEPYDINNPYHNDPTKYKIYAGTVFDHVLASIRKNKLENPLVNLSLLFHDIGKNNYNPKIYKFHKHAERSKDIIDIIAKRLKLTTKEKNSIMFSAVNHMKMHHALNMKPMKILKLVNDENWGTLKAVSYCDDACRLGMFDKKNFDNTIDNMEKIAKKWNDKIVNNTIKIINGKHVMQLTGIKPSKKVGEIIKRVTGLIIDNGSKDNIDDLIMKVYNEIKDK